MKVIELELEKYLSSRIYDPSPNRLSPDEIPVSERTIPIIYNCDECGFRLSFKPEDFEKHNNLKKTNLRREDNIVFETYIIKRNKKNDLSYLDFYCPKCNQATMFLYQGGPSGYWGIFELEIKKILVLKSKIEETRSFETSKQISTSKEPFKNRFKLFFEKFLFK